MVKQGKALGLDERMTDERCECGHTPGKHSATTVAIGDRPVLLFWDTLPTDCTAHECQCQVYRTRSW